MGLLDDMLKMIDDSKDFPDKKSRDEAKEAVREAFREEGVGAK